MCLEYLVGSSGLWEVGEGNPYVFIVAIGVCAEKHGRAQVPEANFQNSETFRRGEQ